MSTFPGNGVYVTQLRQYMGHLRDPPNEEVKPCPFCGANHEWLTVERGGYIHCVRCGADGPEVRTSHRHDGAVDIYLRALPAWNKRT
jgi:formate dehydrogenase maturation protein FdhE